MDHLVNAYPSYLGLPSLAPDSLEVANLGLYGKSAILAALKK